MLGSPACLRVPSESETYEPLDPPDNESDAGDVESGPSNLDAEQEEELMSCVRTDPILSNKRKILSADGKREIDQLGRWLFIFYEP